MKIFYVWIKGTKDYYDFQANFYLNAGKKYFHRYGIRQNDIVCVSFPEGKTIKEFTYQELVK